MCRKRLRRILEENQKAELSQRQLLLTSSPASPHLLKYVKLFYLRFNFCSFVIHFCLDYII